MVSYDEKQVPHKWVTIKEPTYQDEYKEVDQLVPVRDQYGTITGYERKMRTGVRPKGRFAAYS